MPINSSKVQMPFASIFCYPMHLQSDSVSVLVPVIACIKVNNNYISIIVIFADKQMAEVEVLQMPESSFAKIIFEEPKSPGMGNCCSYLITIKVWFLL